MNNISSPETSELSFSTPFHATSNIEEIVKSDDAEKQKIISALLEGLLANKDSQNEDDIANNKYNEDVYWDESFIALEQGSSFEQALQPGAVMLQRMIDKPAFKDILTKYGVAADAPVYVVREGHIIATNNGADVRLTHSVKQNPELNDDLSIVVEIAATIGGVVFLDNLVGIAQWLTFHEHDVPEDVASTRNLINHFQFEYPPSPPLGNYWEMITESNDMSAVLSPDERIKIRTLTTENIGGKGKLLTDLCQIALGPRSKTVKRLNCRELLHELGTHPYFKSWSEGYIKALGWYGSNPGEPISDLYLEQVLMTAILLDLHPGVGEGEARNHVAGYNLYAPDNTEKPVSPILTELEKHLEENHEIPAFATTLAAYLLLAGRAPEFLVGDLPDSLLLGTPEWITFCRGVALTETNASGSALAMTYSKVMQLEAIEPVHKNLEILHGVLAVDPIVDWALLNNVITLEHINDNYQASVESAIAAYQKFSDLYTQVATTLSNPLPTRKEVSLEILKHIVPGCDFLEGEILYEKQRGSHEFNNFDPLAMSMVELNMSNHLGTRDWDLKKGQSIYQTFPRLLPNLVSTEDVFKRRFDKAYAPFKKATATTINLALSKLPSIDRIRLLCGEVTFLTIRPSVAFIKPPEPFPQEKQKDKDAATGRYGVVMCSKFEGRLYCYELFTLHGECRENPKLAKLIQKENLLQQPSRLDFTGHINSLSKFAKPHTLPTDIESYTHGVPHGVALSSQGVIDKLGSLPASGKASSDVQQSHYMSFYSGQFDALVDFILKHRPVWTYEELIEDARGRTKLELKLAKEEEDFETFINVIVPFKSCIEDVTSDDPDRNRGSVLSCTIELAMTVLLVVGVAAKAISATSKAVSIASKSRVLAKTGLGFINSVFNPLDGTPELLFSAGKFLKKGVVAIGRSGLNTLDTAAHQLRRLTGSADSYDLIKAAQRTDFGQGTWRPLGSSADAFVLSAARRHDDWYALNRVGQPWGRKLNNFELSFKSYFRQKLMPDSFVFSYVKKSLPIAQTKIDTALHQLVTASADFEVKSIVKYVFGNDSAETVGHFTEALRTMKTDISHVTIKNVDIVKTPKKSTLASMFPSRFAEWKAGKYHADAVDSKFLRIYSDNMTRFFQKTKFDKGRVADGFVHEMSHGSQRTIDLMYANPDPINGLAGDVDVTALMNLAKKPNGLIPAKMPDASEEGFIEFLTLKETLPKVVANSPALLNADSYALAVALLNQRSVNYPRFLDNLVQMKNKFNAAQSNHIKDKVIVNLSTLA